MAIKRSGRSLPAGPAITPQASSGWSARAWATILSYSARGIVRMIHELTAPGPREPKAAGSDWTEERRRSDEGRRGPASRRPPAATGLRSDEGATREGAA